MESKQNTMSRESFSIYHYRMRAVEMSEKLYATAQPRTKDHQEGQRGLGCSDAGALENLDRFMTELTDPDMVE